MSELSESSLSTPATPRRVEDLDVHEVEDGYVVYDERTDRVHYVNATAVLVLELCDGERNTEEIAGLVKKAFGLETVPIVEVAGCLSTLAAEKLVE